MGEQHPAKQVVLDIFEALNAGDIQRFRSLITPDYVDHGPAGDTDADGVLGFFVGFVGAFPDLRMDVRDVIAEGDLAAWRVVMTGTHQGDFNGIPATGRRIEMDVINMGRMRDGKAAEHWAPLDRLQILEQLGVAPAPATT